VRLQKYFEKERDEIETIAKCKRFGRLTNLMQKLSKLDEYTSKLDEYNRRSLSPPTYIGPASSSPRGAAGTCVWDLFISASAPPPPPPEACIAATSTATITRYSCSPSSAPRRHAREASRAGAECQNSSAQSDPRATNASTNKTNQGTACPPTAETNKKQTKKTKRRGRNPARPGGRKHCEP
jgi:hypothetical protein